MINGIRVCLKGGWTPFRLYPLEYHSVGYACSIYLLFVFLTHKIMWVLCPFCTQLCYSYEDYYQLMSYPHCFPGNVVGMLLVCFFSLFNITLLLSNVCIGCYSVDVFRWSAATNSALISCYWFNPNPQVVEQLPLFELL